jgi:hypothetical protein
MIAEEFTVIGSVGRVSQSFCQTVNSSPVADSNCHYQRPEMLPGPSLKMIFNWSEKTLQFFWNLADCKHMIFYDKCLLLQLLSSG